MYNRLTVVDNSMLSDHYYLTADDVCTFMGEYTARKGFGYSETNQLIFNFKKSPLLRSTAQWQHKLRAINTVAASLATCLKDHAGKITLIPVPPSKCKSDNEYDDRLLQVLNICQSKIPDMEYRELITQTVSTDAAHQTDDRPQPDDLIEIYDINESLLAGMRDNIIIVDDMLTTGCHFRAMESVLRRYFPTNTIAGVFVARRAPDTDMFSVIDI